MTDFERIASDMREEWLAKHEPDENGFCPTCKGIGLNCIANSGFSPDQVIAVEETTLELQRSIRTLEKLGIGDIKELKFALRKAKLKLYSMQNENKCTCDKEYGEADPDCVGCLDQWRNERYGPDIHNVNCGCSDCVPGGFVIHVYDGENVREY